jgi:glutathione synthase/RimK-type ligase-like ATP-grasp enzyme
MRYSEIALPRRLADQLVALTRSYGLYFAAIDLVLDPEGNYWFLELNPAGQWAWLEQEIGVPISAALTRCLLGSQS